jgi:predicted DNA binding protein
MAKTFYKYEERVDLNSYVDWGSIGKTVSDDLTRINKERQAKKDEIDRVTNESVTAINELSVGQPQVSSEFYMDAANNVKEALGLAYREMKAGRLNPNEYLKQRQNIMDDLGQMQSAATSFATDWEEMTKRLEDGTAGEQEIYQNELLDSFGITKDKAVYVNPVDGRMYIATRDAQGNVIKDPSKLMPISYMTARRKDKVNRYDVVGETNKRVKALGDVTRSIMSGGVMSLTDVMQRPEYMKAEDDIVSSMMASSRAAASVLADYVGGYSFTQNWAEAQEDPNKILLKQDLIRVLQPQLTDKQKEVAREALRAQLRVQLKSIETPRQPQQQQQWQYAAGQERKEQQTNVGRWHNLAFGATKEAQTSAANQLLGTEAAKEAGLSAIIPSGKTITLKYDGSGTMRAGSRTFNAEDVTAQQWAEMGNEIHGVDDVNRALSAAGVSNPNQKFAQEALQGTGASRTRVSAFTELPKYVASNLPSVDDLKGDDEGKVRQLLEASFAGLGFTFDTKWFNDEVVITAPEKDGEAGATLTISVDSEKDGTLNQKAISDFITANTSPENLAQLYATGGLSGTGELD